MINILEFYKKSVQHEWQLLQNLIFIFQVENVSFGKIEKELNISCTIQLIFIKFSPIWSYWIWPSNAIEYLEN